jgi:hypothetical protein
MEFDYTFGNGQSQAEAAEPNLSGLLKWIENLGERAGRDSNPAVDHLQTELALLRSARVYGNRAVGWRKLDGIFDHIPEDLLQAGWVRPQGVFSCCEVAVYRQALGGDFLRANFQSGMDEGIRIDHF